MTDIDNVTMETDLKTDQYVSFNIGSEIYGIEVMKVQEVLGNVKVTSVPKTMPFMKGVYDLRNTIIPIIDMRLKFNLEEKDYDRDTVTIITEIHGVLIGLTVDSVSDVINMPITSIQNTPHFSSEIDSDFIKGIGKHDGKIIIILEVDKIFRSEELELMKQKESA